MIFTLSDYKGPTPAAQAEQIQINQFPNGELWAAINVDVKDKDCLLVGTVAPPSQQLLAFTLAAHTLRRNGAGKITACLPYLAYARQDRAEPNKSLGLAWLGQLLAAAGVNEIVTVDLHSQTAADILPVRLHSLDPTSILASAIKKLEQSFHIVAPDEGATERAEKMAQALQLSSPLVMRKQRIAEGIQHVPLVKPPDGHVLIVDDVLDTGETLISCCRQLQKQGVADMVIAVTHGLFTGTAWQVLWKLGVSRILIGDALPLPEVLQGDPRVEVCALQPILAQLEVT